MSGLLCYVQEMSVRGTGAEIGGKCKENGWAETWILVNGGLSVKCDGRRIMTGKRIKRAELRLIRTLAEFTIGIEEDSFQKGAIEILIARMKVNIGTCTCRQEDVWLGPRD